MHYTSLSIRSGNPQKYLHIRAHCGRYLDLSVIVWGDHPDYEAIVDMVSSKKVDALFDYAMSKLEPGHFAMALDNAHRVGFQDGQKDLSEKMRNLLNL